MLPSFQKCLLRPSAGRLYLNFSFYFRCSKNLSQKFLINSCMVYVRTMICKILLVIWVKNKLWTKSICRLSVCSGGNPLVDYTSNGLRTLNEDLFNKRGISDEYSSAYYMSNYVIKERSKAVEIRWGQNRKLTEVTQNQLLSRNFIWCL